MHLPSLNVKQPLRRVQSFTPNYIGRDFIVGDVHGHWDAFARLIAKIKFNCLRDRMFLLGDAINHGPESHRVLCEIRNNPGIHSLMGNHERDALIHSSVWPISDSDLQRKGMQWLADIDSQWRTRIVAQLRALPWLIEIQAPNGQTLGLTHAGVPKLGERVSWQELRKYVEAADEQDMLCEKSEFCRKFFRKINRTGHPQVEDIDAVLVGHSEVTQAQWSQHAGTKTNVKLLDTASSPRSELTAVEVLTVGGFRAYRVPVKRSVQLRMAG